MLLCLVENLSAKYNCTASNEYLSETLQLGGQTIQRAIKSLKDNDIIRCYEERVKGSHSTTKRIIYIQYNTISNLLNDNLKDIDEVTYLRNLDYNEYLKTEHWQLLRKKALQNAHNECQLCNSKESLNVHHKSYKNRGIKDKEINDLIVLCKKCHGKFHDVLNAS